MNVRRLWVVVGVLSALVLVAAVVVAVRSELLPSRQGSGASCSPQPCVDAGGYRMHVNGVQRSDGIVRLQVSFQVNGPTNMHAEPVDFSLEQGSRSYHPYFNAGAGCPAWPRTQIPDGTSLGPETICFKPATTSGRLTLNWDPDLGLSEYFSSGYDLTL